MEAVDVRMRRARSDKKYPDRTAQQNAVRALKRATEAREFVGVDGEGVTVGNVHSYVLLSVGSDSLHKGGAPLSFDDIAGFLWDERILYGPETVFVGFYLSYDFTMWHKSLPESRARMMLTDEGAAKRVRKMGKNPVPFPVYYEGWEMDMHAGKRFKLRPRGSKESWLYVCDVGPFFQTSFLKAIDPKGWPEPVVSDAEYATIAEGKAKRSSAVFDPAMVRYNTLENDVLGRVMRKLDEGFTGMGIRLRKTQWYGPGQAAQAWLNNIKAPTREDVEQATPDDVMRAAQASYYGGWFEITCHGLIPGKTYEYDINSAYPAIIAGLPCLLHGKWSAGDGDGDLKLLYATIRGTSEYLGAGPHRTRDGIILRPNITRGWFWLSEIQGAQRAGAIDSVDVHRTFSYRQSCDHHPLADIADLYAGRLVAGKNSPLGKARKLVYNSSYGKSAQSIGEPKYANPIYASLITAGCRAMIWDAIATHPGGLKDVTMVATDAVFFRSKHPSLPISSALGEWDFEIKENLCQFMPGVYWDDKARNRPSDDEIQAKTRGISARDLAKVVSILDRDFSYYSHVINGSIDTRNLQRVMRFTDEQVSTFVNTWPHVSVPISFGLISAKLALHRNNWESAGTISSKPRLISANPSDKRDPATVYVDELGVIRSRPYNRPPGALTSTAYDKTFGMKLRAMMTENDIISEDGQVLDEIYDYVSGE